MNYNYKHQTPNTKHWQTYVLSLSQSYFHRKFHLGIISTLNFFNKCAQIFYQLFFAYFIKQLRFILNLLLSLTKYLPCFSSLTSLWSFKLILAFPFLYAFNSQALSATTAASIVGTRPYFTFDDGATKSTTIDDLLRIKLSDGTSYTKSTNSSSVSNPIILPVEGQKFTDIEIVAPSTSNSIDINTLVSPPYNYWIDDDGDTNASASGTISVQIEDSYGSTLADRDYIVEQCRAPYKITLTSSSGVLKTKYGIPDTRDFVASSTTYFISPKLRANSSFVCFAKPSLKPTSGSNGREWNSAEGFVYQSLNRPDSNFPTTGFNGAFFDLKVGSGIAQNVINTMGSTVNAKSGDSNIKLALSIVDSNALRVELIGPDVTNPAPLTSPTKFELMSGQTIIYNFVLTKWFIPTKVHSKNASSYCPSLTGNYRVPSLPDLDGSTNTIFDKHTGYFVGRKIGVNGLFGEWGDVTTYTKSNFTNGYYITSLTGFVLIPQPMGRPWKKVPTHMYVRYDGYEESLLDPNMENSTAVFTLCVNP